MAVRLDNLDPFTEVYADHELAAMRNGASGTLTAAQIASLLAVNAPTALDTLQKLAAAINNDATFYQTVADAIATAGAQDASETVKGKIEIATAAEIRTMVSNILAVTPGRIKDAMAPVTLTDAATVAWDMSLGIDFTLTATAAVGNTRTLGNPTNVVVGRRGRIDYWQDSIGGRSISRSSNMRILGGGALTMPLGPSAEGVIYYDAVASNRILLSFSALAWA